MAKVVDIPVPPQLRPNIRCGTTTCASEPGVFCRWFRNFGVGTQELCTLFNTRVYCVGGWIARCYECVTWEREWELKNEN